MFKQSDAIRDFVFPIATIEESDDGLAVKRFLGSGFVIGSRGFALTAKHVIFGQGAEKLAAVFALPGGGWWGVEIVSRDEHPTEDVALIRLDGGPWHSFFRLSNSAENASCKYRLFGYPDDTTFELYAGARPSSDPTSCTTRGIFAGAIRAVFRPSAAPRSSSSVRSPAAVRPALLYPNSHPLPGR